MIDGNSLLVGWGLGFFLAMFLLGFVLSMPWWVWLPGGVLCGIFGEWLAFKVSAYFRAGQEEPPP